MPLKMATTLRSWLVALGALISPERRTVNPPDASINPSTPDNQQLQCIDDDPTELFFVPQEWCIPASLAVPSELHPFWSRPAAYPPGGPPRPDQRLYRTRPRRAHNRAWGFRGDLKIQRQTSTECGSTSFFFFFPLC